MNHGRAVLASAAMLSLVPGATARAADRIADPLNFFEGRTESVSTIKVMMKKPVKSRSIGRGKLLPDHSLDLVQHVEEEGKPPHDRRWKIRRVAPGRYAGTMSDAVGPVTIEETPKGYRFRFKLDGHLSVEQWLTPIGGGSAARSMITVRKYGLAIAKSEGTIRKLN